MQKIFTLITCLCILCIHTSKAQVVINEVYGGGGNSGASYKYDFIELYNNGSTDVSLSGWSVQYASATGSTWAATNLSGTISAHGFYLVQEAIGAGGTLSLPTPDATGTLAMSATAGKVVLCNVTALQTGANPSGVQVVDLVGFGTANGFEGTAPAPAPSNTTSIQRNPLGTDNNQNSTDFVTGSPSPTNSGTPADVTPPTIASLQPANNALGVSTNSNLSIVFSEAILVNRGFVKIINNTTNTFDLVDVTTPNVGVSNNTATVYGVNLQPGINYSIIVADTNFKDLAGNGYAGFNSTATWNFTISSTAANTSGFLDSTYNLNDPATVFGTDGFRQFSVTGSLTWSLTTFGRNASSPPSGNAPNGLQMNGYDNALQSNATNEDWLISPRFDLTATNFPLLSFWSRTKFNGAPLQVKVSTDYPGSGDPRNYTWSDVNGRLPGQTSDVWTLSSNINLANYKQSAVFLAFVYTSTNEEGARWTLDDIRLDNSPTAPPATISLSTTDIQFGFASSGAGITKTFVVTGNEITGNINLSAAAGFTLSADGSAFSPAISLSKDTANNAAKTVFVRFQPAQDNQNYTGTVTINTPGVSDTTISLKGSSIDPANTLEVVNWNLEWFGSTSFGPTNEDLQEQNVKTILQNIGADIYGLVEVVDTARLGRIVRQMPGYSYIVGNFGSHANPFETGPSPMSEAQKLGFVYKTSMFSNIDTASLLSQGVNTAADLNNPSYNDWSSGRYPFMMKADVTMNGVTKTIRFILLHAKANTSPTTTSYNRRKAGADSLHNLLNTRYPNDNLVLLGDFNDDLDKTITDGINPPTTSYSSFINDPAFYPVTLSLSNAGKASTTSYSDMIDQVVVSDEMKQYYLNNTVNVLNDVSSLVTSYASTTSDHYPVFSRFSFDPALLPVTLAWFNATKRTGKVVLEWATAKEANSKQFVIERSGDGKSFSSIGTVNAAGNASGTTNYSYTDQQPLNGNNFYRLRQVDVDGKWQNSTVVKVFFGEALSFSVSPNPSRGIVTAIINNLSGPATLQLTNLNGQVLKQQLFTAMNGQPETITLTGLVKGVYILKVFTGTDSKVEKIIVE